MSGSATGGGAERAGVAKAPRCHRYPASISSERWSGASACRKPRASNAAPGAVAPTLPSPSSSRCTASHTNGAVKA